MEAVIAMPSVRGDVRIETMTSVITTMDVLRASGIRSSLAWQTFAEAPVARNILTYNFMNSSADILIMQDDDIGIAPMVVERMLGAGYPMMGVYAPPRGLDLDRFADYVRQGMSVREACHATAPLIGPATDIDHAFVEVDYIGGGFLFMHRSVFETIEAAGLARPFDYNVPGGKMTFRSFFNNIATDTQMLSEDYAFCQRYREAGGTIHAYRGEGVSHYGVREYRS